MPNTLVISDIHLGSPVCRVKSLAKVLKNEKYKHLIINGDLFDNKYMEKYKINTPRRMAAFIAQIAHESGEFNFVLEIASGDKYDPDHFR